jgi:serine/threonine protein kinase
VQKGEVIRGRYVVTATMPGAGKSETARATAGGRDVFLKRFTAPLYPFDASAMSQEALCKRQALCAEFEHRHVTIIERLSQTILGGGNLVKPTDFFRERGSYYKAYPFVAAESSAVIEREHPGAQQLFVKTFLLSLRELHHVDVVHSDLKPDNVLVERKPAGPVAKLIDFDEAYVATKPPAKRLGGTETYFSPEHAECFRGAGDPTSLGTASDVFGAALIINRIIAGRFPDVDGGSGETPGERVATGATIVPATFERFPAGFNAIFAETFRRDPSARPTVDDLLVSLGVPSLSGSMVRASTPRSSTSSSTGMTATAPAHDSLITSSVGRRARRAPDTAELS